MRSEKIRVKTEFDLKKEEFASMLKNLIESKKEQANEYLQGASENEALKSKDRQTVESCHVVGDWTYFNDVYGVSLLKQLLKLLKSDTRYWAKALRNICNDAKKLSVLQIKNKDGYKLLSFILDYADKRNDWSDINELGKIVFANYENKYSPDAFHFLRSVLTNSSFLIRYGYFYLRDKNMYSKSKTKIYFIPNEEYSKINGINNLFKLYTDCLLKNKDGDILYDFDKEFDSLFSLLLLARENNPELENTLKEFLEELLKIRVRDTESVKEFINLYTRG